MARLDKELYQKVRASGVRKRVARTVAEAAGKADSKTPKALNDAARSLRSVASELEDRAKGGPAKRKAAAQKAARSRKANAQQRSTAAKKGAKTRAKASSTRSTAAKKGAKTRAKAPSTRSSAAKKGARSRATR